MTYQSTRHKMDPSTLPETSINSKDIVAEINGTIENYLDWMENDFKLEKRPTSAGTMFVDWDGYSSPVVSYRKSPPLSLPRQPQNLQKKEPRLRHPGGQDPKITRKAIPEMSRQSSVQTSRSHAPPTSLHAAQQHLRKDSFHSLTTHTPINHKAPDFSSPANIKHYSTKPLPPLPVPLPSAHEQNHYSQKAPPPPVAAPPYQCRNPFLANIPTNPTIVAPPPWSYREDRKPRPSKPPRPLIAPRSATWEPITPLPNRSADSKDTGYNYRSSIRRQSPKLPPGSLPCPSPADQPKPNWCNPPNEEKEAGNRAEKQDSLRIFFHPPRSSTDSTAWASGYDAQSRTSFIYNGTTMRIQHEADSPTLSSIPYSASYAIDANTYDVQRPLPLDIPNPQPLKVPDGPRGPTPLPLNVPPRPTSKPRLAQSTQRVPGPYPQTHTYPRPLARDSRPTFSPAPKREVFTRFVRRVMERLCTEGLLDRLREERRVKGLGR